ncbi:MAG: hypothetical protein HY908_15595 [Myxococcales bacterium]|nr:hypothetical protein [Myxococcales bacterium]
MSRPLWVLACVALGGCLAVYDFGDYQQSIAAACETIEPDPVACRQCKSSNCATEQIACVAEVTGCLSWHQCVGFGDNCGVQACCGDYECFANCSGTAATSPNREELLQCLQAKCAQQCQCYALKPPD